MKCSSSVSIVYLLTKIVCHGCLQSKSAHRSFSHISSIIFPAQLFPSPPSTSPLTVYITGLSRTLCVSPSALSPLLTSSCTATCPRCVRSVRASCIVHYFIFLKVHFLRRYNCICWVNICIDPSLLCHLNKSDLNSTVIRPNRRHGPVRLCVESLERLLQAKKIPSVTCHLLPILR